MIYLTNKIHRTKRYKSNQHLAFKRVKKTYARSTWVTEIKPIGKNCLATIITEKLWLATKQKQKHDLQP